MYRPAVPIYTVLYFRLFFFNL